MDSDDEGEVDPRETGGLGGAGVVAAAEHRRRQSDGGSVRSASRELFEQFLEFAPDAIVGIEPDGRINLVNAQAEALFGYARHELVGQPVERLVPEHGWRAPIGDVPVAVTDVLRAEGIDLLGRRKDGTEFPAEISLSNIETDDGVIATAAIRDVSDRVRAQRRFVQFLEFAPDAIVGVGRGGHIELVNAQTEALFGYARDELIGELVEVLLPERFRAKHSAHRGEYFADPRTRPMGAEQDLFGRRKDGSEFPAEISLSSIDSQDGMLAVTAIRDISDRVEAEAARVVLEHQLERVWREQAQREKGALEEQLNQMRRLDSVGQLAGGIAHDFNNILGVILNSAAFVAEDLDDDSPVLEDVEEIRRSAQRAAALTRQLLIFSRRDVVHPESLDLNEVVSELQRLLRRVLGEHILLATRFAPGLWPVTGDPGQIEQVLVNLAVNARDAMPGGGRIIIETSNIDLDEDYAAMHPRSIPGPHVLLSVSDTGVGMTREVARRAFEPFFTTKPKGEGTGLGLATVYGIVTDAGGTVQIYSEPALGTTVKVLLPVSASQAVPPVEQRPSPRATRGETVLVVEDEDSVRRVTRRILSKGGYNVLTATRGQEALEICERVDDKIDLLLTDVIMPEILGPELATRATELRPGLAVLFMSGYADQVVEHKAESGANIPFVEKPFTAETLLAGVDDVLSRAEA
jgi:PAS domain S-box-containing protein